MNLQMLRETSQRQLEVLQDILRLEKEKYEHLLSGKLKDFATINQELLESLEKLEIAELERNSTLTEFTESHSSIFGEKVDIRFFDVVRALEGSSEHASIESLYLQTRETVDLIKYYTTVNKDLIESALNVLNITLGQQGKEIDYTKRSEAKENHSLLVNKII